MDKNRLWFVSDETYIRLRYERFMGKKLNLKNPTTYNEKLQWLKLHDRRDIYTIMADKDAVKEYVSNIIGEEYIIPTLGVYKKFSDIDFSTLPKQFVIKCNHDSGGVVIVKDKTKLDKEKAAEIINNSMRKNFYFAGREWPYKNIKRKIIIEPYLEDKKYNELRDYKFFCFNGKFRLMFIATGRQSKKETCFDFYDDKFKHLDIINGHPMASKIPEMPINVKKMAQFAEKLSKGYPHIRVDFYEVNGKVYFGELTLYHWSGFIPFQPEEWDYKMGDWIDLSLVA